MAKKRIFELARELGYTNRDLIDKLQKLGIPVKSHSSTADEDEVRTTLKKAEDERRARTVESRVSRGVIRRRPKGEGKSVVRRRPATPPAEAREEKPVETKRAEKPEPPVESTPAKAPPEPEAAIPEVPPEPVAKEEVPAQEEAAPADEPTAEKPAAQAEPEPEAQVTAEKAETEEQQPPSQEEPEAEAKEAEEKPEEAKAEEAAEKEAAPTKENKEKKERREARTARPDRKQREETYDEDDEKPDMEDMGISEFDFAIDSAEREEDVKGVRVAPPSPATKAEPKKEDAHATTIVRTIDPNVLKARLKASKRPEPPKEWGKQEMPASPVTELVVRKDATTNRRELVDVRKEAARGKTRGARRREEMSAKDLLEHRRGQVYYPAPSRKRVKSKRSAKKPLPTGPVVKKPIGIGDTITIAELSQQMSLKATQVITFLMKNGVMATINQPIDHDTAAMVCTEFGYEVESKLFVEEEHLSGMGLKEAKAAHDDHSKPRAPVVTVMGHVDHGKTSLLDKIRATNVASGEAGGITQRIAGYQVKTAKGMITFLDTPGHKAFTAMRARGAHVTDIVILVVASDDGVMPQTIEAIEHAQAAKVPIIVAINKIDKPDANPDRVLQQLADRSILVEEWGGDVLSHRVSAMTGDGIDELLESIALQTEIMELRADPEVPAVGVVVEGHLHKGRGAVATVLIQEGTLHPSEYVVVGEFYGRIRAMMNDKGKAAKEATPSMPVEILGLSGVPSPGDNLRVAKSLDDAKQLAQFRIDKRRSETQQGQAKVSLEDLFARINAKDQEELRIVIKADVAGSVEALRDELTLLTTKKVRVNVISGSAGAVVESDVEFAKASEAIIVGFGVRPDTKALKSARSLGVDIRTYNVIYEAVDEVKDAMRGKLAPVSKEKYLGRAEVRQTFNVPKVGTVAGCAIVDGVVTRSANIRLLRDSKPIYQGKLSSLKRFKDDAREVKEGFECGMGIEKFNDLKPGDVIEAYEIVLTEAVLDEATADHQ